MEGGLFRLLNGRGEEEAQKEERRSLFRIFEEDTLSHKTYLNKITK